MFEFLYLAAHQFLAKLGLALQRSELLLQVLTLYLQPALPALILAQPLRDLLLLPSDPSEFFFAASDLCISLVQGLLDLLFLLPLKLLILLEDLLLDLRLSELALVLGLAVQEGRHV